MGLLRVENQQKLRQRYAFIFFELYKSEKKVKKGFENCFRMIFARPAVLLKRADFGCCSYWWCEIDVKQMVGESPCREMSFGMNLIERE